MPTPKEGETQSQFMGRCMPMRHTEHPQEPHDQSIAICLSIWRKSHPKDKSAQNPKDKKQ